MNATLRQLRTFLAVADARHFRVAAERLHLTQPAVSRHVAELESQLGVRLFDRNTRGVTPTALGERLQGALGRVLDDLDAVLAQTRSESEGLRGSVRVAAGPTPSAEVMPRCIAQCAREYPDITLLARDRIQSDVLSAVRAGEVDFGLVIDPPASRELVTETIVYDPFVLVCHRDHSLARQQQVQWRELENQVLVLLDHSSGSRRLIDSVLAERQIGVRIAQETGHTHTAFRMVEAGLGSSITLGLSAPQSPLLATRALLPEVRRAITLVRRRAHSLSPPAESVWKLLRKQAARRSDRQGSIRE